MSGLTRREKGASLREESVCPENPTTGRREIVIIVTDRAKEELKKALSDAEAEPGVGLRLDASAPGQFGLVPDRERGGDQVVEHEGTPVLYLSEELSSALDGATIDCRDTPEGQQLVISKG